MVLGALLMIPWCSCWRASLVSVRPADDFVDALDKARALFIKQLQETTEPRARQHAWKQLQEVCNSIVYFLNSCGMSELAATRGRQLLSDHGPTSRQCRIFAA